MSNQIEIKIDGKRLTPERFVEAVQSFFSLVQGVAKNVTVKPIDWIVEIDKGSYIVRMRGDGAEQSIRTVCRGVRSLRSGVKIIPPGFTQSEVRASKRLAGLIDGTDVKSVSIIDGESAEDVPKAVVDIADAILAGEACTAFGSIEGKIVSISDKHGFVCSITDPIHRREIVCYFQNDVVAEEAYRGFRKRALAGGLIRYAKDGHPTSIAVDTIRIFPEESELPTVEEVQAIFA